MERTNIAGSILLNLALGGLLSIVVVGCQNPAKSTSPATDLVSQPPFVEEEIGIEDQHIELKEIEVQGTNLQRLKNEPLGTEMVEPLPLHSALVLRPPLLNARSKILECQQVDVDTRGILTLFLELSREGHVVGGTSEPKGGEEGMAKIADCVLDLVSDIKFPPRTSNGRTVLIVPYRLFAVDSLQVSP